MYHTSTADLEKKPIVNFILEYAEAAEDLAEERKRAKEKARPPIGKTKHKRR